MVATLGAVIETFHNLTIGHVNIAHPVLGLDILMLTWTAKVNASVIANLCKLLLKL